MNAEDIVRRLAAISSEDIIEHLPSVGAVGWVRCKLCRKQDRKHAEDCPWFMARLWSVIPPDVRAAQDAERNMSVQENMSASGRYMLRRHGEEPNGR